MTSCLPAMYIIASRSAVLSRTKEWQSICWDRVTLLVKSIQSRIVKAVRADRWNKVKVLQGILTRSYAARLLAIRRVTENRGKKTSGIDGQLWNTPNTKFKAISQLRPMGYQPSPVKRIKILKSNGKWRKLGIPTMKDRAMQALHLLALDPISESSADLNSYGFRPHRSCADAIERCFHLLCKKGSPVWILEGDIKGCFDNISHEWLIENIPMNKAILTKWLKAGYMDKKQLFPTKQGTPQGSIISPTLANMVLDGLESVIDKVANVRYTGKRVIKRNSPYRVHFIRYADDFVVTCSDKTFLEKRIQPAINEFLATRGLQLSEEKTQITHIDDGFDFLGQNLRKYKGKLLIKPSKKNQKVFLSKIKKTIKQCTSLSAEVLILQLNPKIRGWVLYHRHVAAKGTFTKMNHQIWKMLWRWACRRHPNNSAKWVKQKYFMRNEGCDWTFFAKTKDGHLITLIWPSSIKIQRHTKIKSRANPYDKDQETYFEKRLERKMLNKLTGRHMLRKLYNRQKGRCLICNQQITVSTRWNAHHLTPKYLGGKWIAKNLVLLHPVCHIQVHQNKAVAAALEEYTKKSVINA